MPDERKSPEGSERDREEDTFSFGGDTDSSDAVQEDEAGPIPERIGPYRILGKLGEGGMGIVYEAEQERPRRKVALKVMRGGHVVDEVHTRMFQREAETLARLRHPNIGGIFEAGHTEGGHDYFAMELVRGDSLDRFLHQRGFSPGRDELAFRMHLFRQICDAVHYAHQRGVIHRDLKPSNIFVVEQTESSASGSGVVLLPQVKILDFGLARITDTDVQAATLVTEVGMIKGTLPYMSPEQALGQADEIDVRTDVYALGVLLYEMLSGHKPYDVTKAALVEAVRVICEDPPKPLRRLMSESGRIDPDVETIVSKALEKEAGRRYVSAAAFSEDVGRYLSSQPILARPPSAVYQMRKFASRNRMGVTAAILVLVAVLAGSVVSFIQYVHAERSAERARVEEEKSSQVASFLGDMLESVGPAVAKGRDTALLREILDQTSDRVADELGDQPEVEATLRSVLGTTYLELGELELAESHFRLALEARERSLGRENPDRATDLNNLGTLLVAREEYDEAEAFFQEAIDLRKKLLGGDHPEVAATLTDMGNLAVEREDFEDAERLLREALEIKKARFPDGDASVAIGLNSMGNLLQHLGRYDEAEPFYREAVEMSRRLQGDDHHDLATNLHNLSILLANKGDLEGGAKLLREALEIQQRVLGPEHPDVAISIGSLGNLLRAMGDWDGAAAYYRQALELNRQIYGERSNAVSNSLNSIGLILEEKGDLETAEALYRQSLDINREVAGDKSLDVASNLNNLAAILVRRERIDDALSYYREALEIQRSVRGDEHPTVALVRNNIGRALRAKGDLDGAETEFRAVLDLRREVLGEEHSQVGISMVDLGKVLFDREQIAEAEALFRDALANLRAALGEEHPATAVTKGALARALVKQGRHAEAEPLYLEGYERLVEVYGADHLRSVKQCKGLAELYEDWDKIEPGTGKAEKAVDWRARITANTEA